MNTLMTPEDIDNAKETICYFINSTLYPSINPDKIEKSGIKFIEDKIFNLELHTPQEHFEIDAPLYAKKTKLIIPENFFNKLNSCLENQKDIKILVQYHQEKIKKHYEDIKVKTTSYYFDFPDKIYIKLIY